jgi:hypothetical protein
MQRLSVCMCVFNPPSIGKLSIVISDLSLFGYKSARFAELMSSDSVYHAMFCFLCNTSDFSSDLPVFQICRFSNSV